MLQKLRFHPRCGDRVTLVCNKKTVVRNCSQLLGAFSFSAEALRDNELFEVRIIKKEGVWNGHIDLGVTSYDPNKAEYMPLAACQIQEPTWIMSGSTILKNGTCVADPYGDDLDMLVEGDCLGVMRSQKGELLYFINNHCLGVAAKNIPANVFAVIELTGKYMEVTITRLEIIPEEIRLRQQQMVLLEEPSSSSYNEIPMAESIELDSSLCTTELSTPRSTQTTPDEAVTSALSNSTDSDTYPPLHKNTIPLAIDDQTTESLEDDISSASEKEIVQSPPVLSYSDIRDEPGEGILDATQLFNSALHETLYQTPDSYSQVNPSLLESTHFNSPKDIVPLSNERSGCSTYDTSSKAPESTTIALSQINGTNGLPPQVLPRENLDHIVKVNQTSNAFSQPSENPISSIQDPAYIETKKTSEMFSPDRLDTKYESHSQNDGSDCHLSVSDVLDQGHYFLVKTSIDEADTAEQAIAESVSSNNIVLNNMSARPSKFFDTITKETVNRLRSRRALEAYGEDSDTEKANIECTSLPDACIPAAATAPRTQYYNITGELVDRWVRNQEATNDTDDESESESIFNDYRKIERTRRNSPQIEVHHTSPPASPSPESNEESEINELVQQSARRILVTETVARDRRRRQTDQIMADPRDRSPPLVHGEAAHSNSYLPDERDSEELHEVVVEPNIVLQNISSPEALSSRSGSSISEVPPDYSDPRQGNVISAADNRDPFRFHRNRGTSIKFSSDFLVAERLRPMDDYNNAVCLTHRPLSNNELFEIKIEKLIDKWSGGIELGVTGHNPRHLDLPSTMTNLASRTYIMSGCKVLLNGKPSGVELSNFSLDDIKVGDCVGMTRNRTGNLHFYLNGVDQGKAASNVPPTVWGVVDLYGTSVKVSIVNSAQQAPQPILSEHNQQQLPAGQGDQEHRFNFIPRAILPANVDNETLLFHSSQRTDIVIVDNGKSAHRVASTERVSKGIVTTNRPLLDNELFEVRLETLLETVTGSLEIGVTTQSPKHQDYIQNIHNYSGCWALVGQDIVHEGNVTVSYLTEDLNTLQEGDRVGVVRNDKGELHFFVNGIDKGRAASDIPELVYGFVDLHGKAEEVSIVHPIPDQNIVPPEIVVVPEPPVPELCFNRVHGRNAQLSSDMTVASRPAEFSEFNEGVLFSSRPLRECELFQVRVDKIVDCWIGSLEIGVTALKPSELESCGVERVAGTATELMWHTYVLSGASVVSDGACLVQRYPLDLDSVTRGSHVGVMWHGDRSLHFYMDGVDQGHACFLPPQLELYAVIDLYGQCTEVTLVPGREHSYWGSGHSDNSLALLGGLHRTVPSGSPDSFSEYCGQNVVVSGKEKIARRVARDCLGCLVFSASHLAEGHSFEVAVMKCDDLQIASFSFGLTDLNILNAHVNRNFPSRISQIPDYCCYLSNGALVVNNKIEHSKTGLLPAMDDAGVMYADRLTLSRYQNGDVSVAYNYTDLGVVFTNLPEKVYVVFDLSGCVSGLQAVPPRKIKFSPDDPTLEDMLVETVEEDGSEAGKSEQTRTQKNINGQFTFKCLSLNNNLTLSDNGTKATRVSDYKGGIVITKEALCRGKSFKFTIDSEQVGYAGGLIVGALACGALGGTFTSALSVRKQCWILSSTLRNIHGHLTPIAPTIKAKFRTMKLNSKIELQLSDSSELVLYIDQLKVAVIARIPDDITEIYPLVDIRGKCKEISIVNNDIDVHEDKEEETIESCAMCGDKAGVDVTVTVDVDEYQMLKENALNNFANTIKELLPSRVFYDNFENNSLTINRDIPAPCEWLDVSAAVLDPRAPDLQYALHSDTESDSFDISQMPQVTVEHKQDSDVNRLPNDVYDVMTTGVIGHLPGDVNFHQSPITEASNSISDISINENSSKSSKGVSDFLPDKLLYSAYVTNLELKDMPDPYSATEHGSIVCSPVNEQKPTCPQEIEQLSIVIPKADLFLKCEEYSNPEFIQTSPELSQECDILCNPILDPFPNDNITQQFEEVFSSMKTESVNQEPNNMIKLSQELGNQSSKISIIKELLKEMVNKTCEVMNEHTNIDIIVKEEELNLSENVNKLLEDYIYICYQQELQSSTSAYQTEIKSSPPVLREEWEYLDTIVSGVYEVVAGSGKETAQYLLGKITSPATVQDDANSDNSICDNLLIDSPVSENENDPEIANIFNEVPETDGKEIHFLEDANLKYFVMETISEFYEDTIAAEVRHPPTPPLGSSDSSNVIDGLSQQQSSIDEVSESLESSKQENINPQSSQTHSSQEERVSELISDKSDSQKLRSSVNSLDEGISDITSGEFKAAELSEKDESNQNFDIHEMESDNKNKYNKEICSEIESDSHDESASRGDASHPILDSPPISSFHVEVSEMENTHESSEKEDAEEWSHEESSLNRNKSDPMEIIGSDSPSKNNPVSSSGSTIPPLGSPYRHDDRSAIKHSRLSKSMPDLTKYHDASIYKDSFFKDIYDNLVTYHLNNGGTLNVDSNSGFEFFIQLHSILYGNSVPFVKPVSDAQSQVCHKEEVSSSNDSRDEPSQLLNQTEGATQDSQIRRAVLGTSPQHFLETIINESHPIIANINQKKNPAVDLFLYAVAENDANIRRYILDDLIDSSAIIDPFEYADEDHIQLHEFFETLRRRYVSSQYSDDVFLSYDNDYEDSPTGRAPLMFVEGVVGANSDTGITFMMNSNVVTRNPRQKQFGYPYTSVYDIKIRPLKKKDRPDNFDNNDRNAIYGDKKFTTCHFREKQELNKESHKRSTVNVTPQFHIPDSESDAFIEAYGSYLLGLVLDRGLIGDDCALYSEDSYMKVAERCSKLGSAMHFWWNWVPESNRSLMWGDVQCYCANCIPVGAPHWIRDCVRVSRVALCEEPVFGRFWSIRAGVLPMLLARPRLLSSPSAPLHSDEAHLKRRPPLSKSIQIDELFSTIWMDEYGTMCIVNIVLEVVPDRDQDSMVSYFMRLTAVE